MGTPERAIDMSAYQADGGHSPEKYDFATAEGQQAYVRAVMLSECQDLLRYMDKEDLMQAGLLGLNSAIGRFRPEEGVKLITYVHDSVWGAMRDLARKENIAKTGVRTRRETSNLLPKNEAGDILWEQVPHGGLNPEEAAAVRERDELMNKLLKSNILNDKEKQLYDLYYNQEKTLKKIGTIMGFNESRASQIFTKLKLKLRTALAERGIRARDLPY